MIRKLRDRLFPLASVLMAFAAWPVIAAHDLVVGVASWLLRVDDPIGFDLDVGHGPECFCAECLDSRQEVWPR